jgi:hypothetical protein
MPGYTIQYPCEKDGCIYCWDAANTKWVKVCPVDVLPLEIQKRIIEDKLRAETLLAVTV